MTFSIYQLKSRFQQLLSPLLAGLIRRNISPNQITVFTAVLSVLFGLAMTLWFDEKWPWLAFPFFMLLRMALNAIDGMLANQTNQKTPLGTVLNEMCDHTADAALYLPFAFVAGVNAGLLVLVVVATLLAELAGLMAVLLGLPRRFDGPMGKSDRAFWFSLIALLIFAGVQPIFLNGLLAVILILLLWTIGNRSRQALIPSERAAPPKQ